MVGAAQCGPVSGLPGRPAANVLEFAADKNECLPHVCMTTVSKLALPETHEEQLAPYRAVCRSAVISLVLALLSLPLVGMAVVSALFRFGDAVQIGFVGGMLAIPAALLGWSGWATVRRYPSEYTGGNLARFGMVTGLGLLVCGFGVASYTYATEVPEGYERVGFWDFQPDPDHPEIPFSPKVFELSGKPIFIKGYMHPGVASSGPVENFILVNDFGTCCFGGQPKTWHMIAVHVPPGKPRPSYSTRSIKLAGKFMLADQPVSAGGLQGVWFHLQADQVQ